MCCFAEGITLKPLIRLIHVYYSFLRPLAPTSVIPAVTAFLNHLLLEIEAEKLEKGW